MLRRYLHLAGSRLVLERQQDGRWSMNCWPSAAANLAEVIGKLVDADIDVARLRELLAAAGVTIEPGFRAGRRAGRGDAGAARRA